MPNKPNKLELRLLDTITTYYDRENPKTKPLAREFNVLYGKLYRRIHGRISPKNRILLTKALNKD